MKFSPPLGAIISTWLLIEISTAPYALNSWELPRCPDSI